MSKKEAVDKELRESLRHNLDYAKADKKLKKEIDNLSPEISYRIMDAIAMARCYG